MGYRLEVGGIFGLPETICDIHNIQVPGLEA